jgi:GxxExxY protein
MLDTTTERIIECIIKVHQIMGRGFLETLYRRALLIEMVKTGLAADTEKEVTI